MKDLEIIKQENKKADSEASDKITAHNKKIREYKEGLGMILKWGGSSEEKMSAAIQLIEELIADLDNLEALT